MKKILLSITSGLIAQQSFSQNDINIPARPNIIIISCEDISPDLGCYGHPVVKTPHIDALAKDGILFERAYSTAGVSAPSRCALITGMYASSIGGNNMRTNQKGLEGIPPHEAAPSIDIKCYSEYLREKGYYCTNNNKTDYQFAPPYSAWNECSGSASWEKRPDGSPFFSIFNIMTSHESQIEYRNNSPLSYSNHQAIVPPYYPDDPIIRRDIVRNYSNITVMDREAGEIIEKLKKQGLYDDALIIFYSDHGGPLARQKREIVESGTHVPLIIKLPKKQKSGTRIKELVSFIDIPPTILSLAGINPPKYMQGQIFLGKKKAKARQYVFAARDRMDNEYDMVRMVRDDQFIYIRNYYPERPYYQDISFRIGALASMKRILELKEANLLDSAQMIWFSKSKAMEQLYLVGEDPHTMFDVANDARYKKDLLRMRTIHKKWMKDIEDKGLRKDGSIKPEKELFLEMWPKGKQPKVEEPEIINRKGKILIKTRTKGTSVVYKITKANGNKQDWRLYTGEQLTFEKGDILDIRVEKIGYVPFEMQRAIE